MTKKLITIGPNCSVKEAVHLMYKYSIRHIPVVDHNELLGLVTESNLRQYFYHSELDSLKVEDVMILNPITVDPNSSIDSAARLIHEFKIGGLPVLDKRSLVGIITTTDILSAFLQFLGLLKESSRLDVILNDTKNLDEVLTIIRKHGGKVISVGMEATSTRKKIHYIRLEKIDLLPIVKAIEEKGHKVVSVLD
ncbi:CBS and ACT domain-containing protein [Dissulfuribacter thermophilus]|nr:CBS and ACT domain-containing protein [Dissulfuribacter thermophilus]